MGIDGLKNNYEELLEGAKKGHRGMVCKAWGAIRLFTYRFG